MIPGDNVLVVSRDTRFTAKRAGLVTVEDFDSRLCLS